MAVKHILSLDIPSGDCSANCEILPIVDTSQYDSKLGVTCAEISITAPGYTAPKIIETTIVKDASGEWDGFGRLNLNACSLGLQTTSCSSSRNSINDGIYITSSLATSPIRGFSYLKEKTESHFSIYSENKILKEELKKFKEKDFKNEYLSTENQNLKKAIESSQIALENNVQDNISAKVFTLPWYLYSPLSKYTLLIFFSLALFAKISPRNTDISVLFFFILPRIIKYFSFSLGHVFLLGICNR